MPKEGEATLEYEAVNRGTALWARSKSDIKDEEYVEFYRHLSHDPGDPLIWSHTRVEGKRDYTSLVFIPGKAVFRYQLRYETAWGDIHQVYNAYSFLPTLGEQDLYLFNEGNEHRIYEKLGVETRTAAVVRAMGLAPG